MILSLLITSASGEYPGIDRPELFFWHGAGKVEVDRRLPRMVGSCTLNHKSKENVNI